MKTASEFLIALEKARLADLTPVHQAVDKAIATVEAQMEKALANPTRVSCDPHFGDRMPAKAFYKGNYKAFLHALNTRLAPTGWMAEESHDGDGVYSTYVVKMVPTRQCGTPRRSPRERYPRPMIEDASRLRG